MVAPVIPAINDAEIERILDGPPRSASGGGLRLLRLPLEVRDLFREWLLANTTATATCSSSSARRAAARITIKWGTRMTGAGPIAWMIGRRFEAACEKQSNMAHKAYNRAFLSAAARAAQLSLF
jgi:DNA repair photolyase